MLTEFGGIACMPEGEVAWGHSQRRTGAELLERNGQLLRAVHALHWRKADARALASATRGVELDECEYAINPFGYSARWLANTKR